MSDPRNNGGPAFPAPYGYYEDGTYVFRSNGGMTLRDYFAAKVMATMSSADYHANYGVADVALMAYAQADAMIAERANP